MDKKILTVGLILAVVLFVTGCTQTTPESNETVFNYTEINLTDADEIFSANNNTANESLNDLIKVDEDKKEPEKIDESKASFTIKGIEGDTIKIPIKAVDPDGDFLEYTFEAPFNEKGLWQTKIGDEGKILTKVTVSDGKLSTSEFVLIELGRANRPPVIECPEKITVAEGESVILDCNIFDVDGDVVLVGYDGWMKTASRLTTFGDAGEYTVVVRAKDKTHEVFKEVEITVTKTNRAPKITLTDSVQGTETEKIVLAPKVSDPDGDEVKLEFSEPFDKNGEWTPAYGDAGFYEVTVTATDGNLESKKIVEVEVTKKNRAPVLKEIKDISVKEGEPVKISVSTYDPDGDDLVVSYSGWMQGSEYTTTYDDAYPDGCDKKGCTAEYEVVVTVSDGVLSTTQTVKIEVEDMNRPPEFVFG